MPNRPGNVVIRRQVQRDRLGDRRQPVEDLVLQEPPLRGDWKVQVTDSAGVVLEELEFKVKQTGET